MELLLAIFLFAASTAITPGPNNIMIMTSGLNHGTRRSLPHCLGICIGVPMLFVFIGLGFGLILDRFPALHEIITLIGVAYLFYLSWIIANSAPQTLKGKERKPFSFLQAVLFQWVNPKAWVVSTGAIAAFTTSASDFYFQVFTIATVFFLVTLPSIGIWLCFGVHLRKILNKPQHQKVFNISMATLLVISMTPIVYELVADHLA